MGQENKLHPNVIPYWQVKQIIITFLLILASDIPLVAYVTWLESYRWLMYVSLPLVVFFLCKGLFMICYGVHMKYSRRSYRLTDDEITIHQGTVWKNSSTVIPISRIQHVDKEQGIIAKKFGLSDLALQTAGKSHHIVGLLEADAEELRKQVIKLAKLGDVDVYHE